MKYTPQKITNLAYNEIFVFGSNESGIHGSGAARIAISKFGAVLGQGHGLMGNSYAIPTKDRNLKPLPLESIKDYLREFIKFVIANPHLTFYLTKVGCGLAGYSTEEIRKIFWEVLNEFSKKQYLPANLIIPKEFDLKQE